MILEYHPVVLAAPTPCVDATATSLPASLAEIYPGDSFYVEYWARQIGPPMAGLNCVHTDVSWDDACLSTFGTSPLAHTSCPGLDFSHFSAGWPSSGLVDEFGGCTLDASVGVAPEWALVATVSMTAGEDCAGAPTTVELTAAQTASTARATEGPPYTFEVPPEQIIYGVADVEIVDTVPPQPS